MDDSSPSVRSPFLLSTHSILKTTLKYELLDNLTGRTLVSGPTAQATLISAAQYILDYNLDYRDVAYVVLKNFKEQSQRGVLDKARAVIFSASGEELRELIEDEKAELEDADVEWDTYEWELDVYDSEGDA